MNRLLIVGFAAGMLVAAGCRHKCCLNDPGRRPAPYLPEAPRSPLLLPPAGVPTTPAPFVVPPGATVVPPVGPDGTSNFPPPSNLGPPTRPAPEVLLPDAIPGGGSSRSSSPGDPGFGLLGTPAKPQTAEPPVTPKTQNTAAGLPGFVQVKDGVATGRKPALEGFDSLKRAGYRVAIYLHPAGADVSVARDVAQKRGLRFVAIETTPEKLTDAVGAFNAAIAEKANRPAYAFDDDGVRTGPVWYLHFRTAEAMNDDAARVRARPLGLTDEGGEARAFALATQRYLETR